VHSTIRRKKPLENTSKEEKPDAVAVEEKQIRKN
jgi:hypothetical protein